MDFDLFSPRQQLAQIMSRIYNSGMTTLSGGNLSIKDTDGSIWITPSGVDKGALTPNDIMCLRPDGTVEGVHRPSMEYPFHRAIYDRRPDINAIVHAHPPALVTFSIARKVPMTGIIPQADRIVGRVGYASYATPGSALLGENIATAFAEGCDSALLENHGVVAAGVSLLDAYQRLETLDFCARTLLRARALGVACALTDEQMALFDAAHTSFAEFIPTAHSTPERELREVIVKVLARAVERQLMISTEGVISARVDDRSFLITPTGHDRQNIAMDDLVLIRDGRREAGKQPSRSARMHAALYEHNPDLRAIIMAQPPNAMAYAVTACQFDSRTIPESYVMLRDVPLISYEAFYESYAAITRAVSARTPVALVQNECVIAVGASVLQAFDRLEVLEFSARSLIDTPALGALVPMNDEALEALRKAFSLE